MAQAGRLKIIDSHLHSIQVSRFQYQWLKPDSPLNRDIDLPQTQTMPDDFELLGGILIEASNQSAEIDYLLELSANSSLKLGVIGWIALDSADAIQQLDKYMRNPAFKGIRMNWLQERALSKSLIAAMQFISERNLLVELLVNPDYLAEISQFVAAFPHITFILNHFAGFDLSQVSPSIWAKALKPIAQCDNVLLKLSGYRKKQPLSVCLDAALDVFGAQRLLYGSNFPMFFPQATYSEICLSLLNAIPDSELQTMIFYQNAERIYRLNFSTEA
jgi:L-fuconolactonase